VQNLTVDTFYETIGASDKILVDFWATWCEPCKAMLPILESIDEEIVEVAKVDVDAEMMLARELGIRSMPTLILFENGQEVSRMIGARPKNEVIEALGL
jgi:thioredoxin 1